MRTDNSDAKTCRSGNHKEGEEEVFSSEVVDQHAADSISEHIGNLHDHGINSEITWEVFHLEIYHVISEGGGYPYQSHKNQISQDSRLLQKVHHCL